MLCAKRKSEPTQDNSIKAPRLDASIDWALLCAECRDSVPDSPNSPWQRLIVEVENSAHDDQEFLSVVPIIADLALCTIEQSSVRGLLNVLVAHHEAIPAALSFIRAGLIYERDRESVAFVVGLVFLYSKPE